MDLKRTSQHLDLYHIRIMVDVVSCECLTTIFARLMCYSVISGDTELRVMERLISKRGPGMSGTLAPPTVQIE